MANLLSDDDVFGSGSNGLLSDSDVFGGEPEKKQNKGIAGDLATDLKRGVQGLPGVLTGIGDMIVAPVVGDAVVGKGWDLVGKKTGFQPSKWAKDAGEEYSPSRQAENASINKAWEDNSTPFSDAASGDFSGIGGIAKAYVQNPMATAGNVVESIPSMALGGLFGKGLGVASKMSPVVSGAIGEGAVMGGQQMTNLTDSGVDGRTASAASWGTAAGGAFVGGASGRIAKAAGLADIDTALAGGAVRGVSTEAADKTIRGSIKEAAKRVSGGAATEGLLEELPQSVLEQTLSNLAQGKPWSEGVARSAVEGTLAGSLMGGAFNALPGKKEDAQTNPPSADALPEIAGLLPAPTYTGTPGDQLVSADAERQASIDAAESANAKLWEERDAYENLKQDLAKNNVTITTDPAPIQQRIDALMGINENRLTGKARSNYEKALDIAFNEQIGVVVGENSLEVPFTMGDYLKSKVAAADITRDRPKAESANQQAVDRLGQLNSEESQQQPDIPVVGVLSRIANAGIRSGAIRRDQTAPVVPPEIQSNPVSNNLSPTQKIDLSQRTDGQLSYLSNKGRPGLREAAIAEIQRRGQTNAAKAQPLAQEATQANDAQAGIEQAAAQNAEVARSPQAQQGADSPVQQSPTTPSIPPEIVSRVAKRTDKELAFMVKANRDPIVREAVAKEIAIRAADQNKIDAVSQSKPDAAPVKSEQPKPAKGAENGQAETEVLNLPGAVKDAAHVKPNVLREARDRRKAKESLPDNDAGLIEPVPDLSESSRQALYESLKSRMLKGEVTLQYGQRQLAAFDEAVKARDEAMQDTADGNPSEEKPSQPKTDNDPEAKQEQATASTEEKSDSGTVDRSKWSIGKYRHAKDSVVLSITEPDGYKGRLARISEALGARYVGRANGYVTSEKKARKAIDLAGKGWDASSFNGELTEPTDEKSKNSDEAVNATVDAGNDEKSEFVKAPDGSIDFGEITKEMSNAMRRQPGKIRLEKGDDSYGEQHIESRRGNQIRGMGFKSIAAFVSDAVKHIESIWKPSKTSQMVLIQATENGKAVFIELKQSDSGDFYTVNTAFPIGSSYTNNKDKWSLLWSGASVPTVASGANPLAESSPNAGVTTTMTPGQSSNSSVAKSEPESKIEDFGKKLYNIADDNVQLSEESARWSSIVSDFFAGKISKTETPTVLRNTPAVLQALGLPDYEIKISLAHGVEDAMYNHGIKPSQLKAIPNLMTDPQAVFVNKGADGKYSLNVLTGITVNGRQVAIALQPSKHGMAPGKVHFIATITPRENGVFAKMAENGFLVYSGNDIPQDISSGLRKATMKYGQSAIDLKALMASKFDSTARTSKIIYRSDVVNLIESGQAQFSADGDVKISPADKAIYGMATEGRSAADILKFIASASRSPFNRQVAKLLLKTGINPTITVDDGKGWKMNAGDGHKYAAAYNPGTDTVALFRPASAERHALHELIHAATIKALSKKGLAAVQMRALFSHVQKNGKAAGLFYDQKTKRGIYGMADIDEFIAEAFSNPKFQALLKQVSAPKTPGSTLSSAWHWFSRIVRGILGLPMNTESALSRALDIGVGVMRENMKINEVISDGITRPSTDRSNPFSRIDEIAKVFERRVGEALSGGRVTGPILVADNTPASMQAFGWADRKVVINLKELQKIAAKPGFETDKAIASIVHDLRRPALMFWNTKNKSINYLRPGKMNMMIGVAPDAEMRNDKDAHLVLTAHLLDRADEQALRNKIERGELVLIYKGREVLGISGLAEKKLPQFNGLLAHGLLHARAADTEAKFKILRESDLVKWEADNWGNGIRYNVADEGWSVSEPSKMDDVIYSLQDKHIDMKRVVQSIFKTGKKVRDEVNAYLQEELFHGRAAKGVKDFLDFELRPLLQEMMRNKIDMGDFEEYLWNAHAQERNEQIAKVNPEMNDGGSGIKTADAKAYLSGIGAERKQIFESLAAKVDAMNRNSQKVLVESGLEKQETIDAWNGAYKHYVPLQREDVDSGHIGTGKGFSIRGSSTKRAMGSGRNVVDIIANLTMQRERNIVRAEKNRVSNALMGLAVENPNDDFWTVDKAPTDRVVEETAIYTVKDVSGEKLEEFTRMSEAERFAKQHPGSEIEQSWGDRVKERIMPGFKSRDNVLLTRVNGEDHYVIFNERDERAMRMALAMKNLDADNLGHVLSVVGKATRYLASINTQFNPVFGVINLIRDTQGALINLSSTPIAGDQKKVLGYTKDALIGIYKDIRAHRAGKKPSSDWAELFEEFQNEGGQTGYRDQYANAEQRAEAIQSELKQFKEGGAKRLVRGVFGWLSDYNETMENAVRLATYKAAKERGISKQQAASVAKSITVNFNRKGQVATQVGALYAFFNASVQGSARLAQTLFEQSDGDAKTIRLSKTGKKILAGGIMLGSMQALLLAAAGFDDDEPPEFIRERNLILPIGDGKYLTLAMPLGFHVIPGIGRIATEFVLAGGKDPIKRMASLFSMFAESFNPVGNAGFSLQTIAPSVVDPFAALAENKDFTGKEIYRENFNALNPTPGHARAKDVASVWSRYISEALNFITGGSEFRPGVFSPSPDAIDYLIGQATGGVGREVTKAGTTIGSAFTGEDLPMYKIPLVGRFVGDTEGQSGQSAKFYDAIKQINMHEAEYKGLISGGRSQEASDYLAENPAVKLIMLGNQTERVVRNLRSKKREMIDSEASQDSIKAIDERITETMARFNERVERVI